METPVKVRASPTETKTEDTVVPGPTFELSPYQTLIRSEKSEVREEERSQNLHTPDAFDPKTWEFAEKCPQGAPLVNDSGTPVLFFVS